MDPNVQNLMEMGFTKERAQKALDLHGQDPELALEWSSSTWPQSPFIYSLLLSKKLFPTILAYCCSFFFWAKQGWSSALAILSFVEVQKHYSFEVTCQFHRSPMSAGNAYNSLMLMLRLGF